MKFLFAFLSVAALSCVRGHPSGIHQQNHISIPDYHPQLQNLGQHVDLPQIPTKVIRITKTVAIKVPVPYPVKVPHRVPYPVQVNKPYPVHVPQIIKVPQPYPVPVESNGHGQGYSSGAGGQSYEGHNFGGGYAGDQGAGGYSGGYSGGSSGGYSGYSPSDSYEHAASQYTQSQLAQQYAEPANSHAQESYQVVQVAPQEGHGYQPLPASQQTLQGYQEGQGGHYQAQEQGSYSH